MANTQRECNELEHLTQTPPISIANLRLAATATAAAACSCIQVWLAGPHSLTNAHIGHHFKSQLLPKVDRLTLDLEIDQQNLQ